ncbi:thioesterase II family protein [Nonomuraea gerenzanensis]|uniref:Thioesterase in siderophore biosynthesis gene cluster n=1 Tax=Nonomuraea gerenzanensis TaxID=93944 RepID=A0A1M4E4R5_9ACTN|nr:alpha/beta fold hydrolase [Nonomuraea gerenzanensis]UBU16053.1 alpha/beta fold hydrolase [Nonomuraea gerenzanensis]SBO93855.1 Thioesterase in siderophore biosynthesis gene cluster [Nonomuraea gerenzanensis]
MTWFHTLDPRPDAALRLFCFPHAGGAAAAYREWHRAVPPGVEVRAVQYPGRADRMREAPVADAHVLADQIAEAMRPLLDRPAVLFGHSMGAVLAYETALRVRPAHLIVSGRRAAHVPRPGRVHLGTEDDLAAELRRLGGTQPELLDDPEVRAYILPIVRADYHLAESYRHRPAEPLDCPITAVIGDSDPEVDPSNAGDWAELTRGRFELHVLPGGHFYLAERPAEVIDLVVGAVSR